MHTRTEVMQSSSTTEQLRGQLEDIKLQISTKDAEVDDLRFKNVRADPPLHFCDLLYGCISTLEKVVRAQPSGLTKKISVKAYLKKLFLGSI